MKKSTSTLVLCLALTLFSILAYTDVYTKDYSPFDDKKLKAALLPAMSKRFGKVSELIVAQYAFYQNKYYAIYYSKYMLASSDEPIELLGICEIKDSRYGKYSIVQEHTVRTDDNHGIELIWLYDNNTGAFVVGGKAQNSKLTQINIHTIRGDSELRDISSNRSFMAVIPEGEGLFGDPTAYVIGHSSLFHNRILPHIRMFDNISGLDEAGTLLEKIVYYR